MIYVMLAYLSYPFISLFSRLFAKREDDSVVVFQTAKIGDMICTTPVFREIKRAYPMSRLGVVADPSTAILLKYNPHVDEVIEFDRRRQRGLIGKISFARALRRKGYSTALILLPNVTNILAAFWAMIPRRISVHPDFAGRTLKKALGLNTVLEYHIAPKMSLETYLLSLRHLNIRKWETRKEVYQSPEAEKKVFDYMRGDSPRIGIALGTGNNLKDWGVRNFTALAGMIVRETGFDVVLLGSEGEKAAGDEIMNSLGYGRVINFCGYFTLAELPALVRKLKLVIGVDTGVVYMADALDIPVIDIAGPCNMDDQRPTGRESMIIQERGLECIPCSHTFSAPYECRLGHRRCVTEISPGQVFRCVLKMESLQGFINGPARRA